jgi:hypothetical protein
MSTARTNRRIGGRHAAAGLYVGWFVDGRPPRRRLLRRTSGRPTAQVLDLSATGARLATDAVPVAPVGARVVVTRGGMRTTVVVRNVGPGSRGRTTYGVEFVELDNPLFRLLADHLDEARPEARRAWESAH